METIDRYNTLPLNRNQKLPSLFWSRCLYFSEMKSITSSTWKLQMFSCVYKELLKCNNAHHIRMSFVLAHFGTFIHMLRYMPWGFLETKIAHFRLYILEISFLGIAIAT